MNGKLATTTLAKMTMPNTIDVEIGMNGQLATKTATMTMIFLYL